MQTRSTFARLDCKSLLNSNLALRLLAIALCAAFLTIPMAPVFAQQGQWIWTPQQNATNAPLGGCHFRKKFELGEVDQVELIAAGDDRFVIYLNSIKIGVGEGSDKLYRVDLTPNIQPGENIIAVQVVNSQGRSAAFAAQIRYRKKGSNRDRWIASDSSWKALVNAHPDWTQLHFTDSTWDSAASIGPVGSTLPWDKARMEIRSEPAAETSPAVAENKNNTPKKSRFDVPDKFAVSKVLDHTHGSYIAMEFNEFGQLLLSQEQGGLLLVDFNNRTQDGKASVTEYCMEVNSCQGILPLNGDVFVIGYGPEGSALYRLRDDDRDGEADQVQTICRFKGEPGEHGPHGMVLGPEGMIYISVGNASGIDEEVADSSPARHFYDIDMLPRQEDRAGHAAGVKAPGGTIVRVSLDGSKKEIVASGLRNAYDIAINASGEMFFHDSDMEADTGTPWYRPTQLYQLVPGADYGWRSGWAKLPYYYIDCMRGICDTGRGSPSGGTFYDHFTFPVRYHGAMFMGDWSEGRILAVKAEPDGAGYRADYETFLKAQPLTVTDLSVGPDGGLYFCTGGRGTQGAVYRVSWEGGVPDSFADFGDSLSKLIRQPQPQSAWGRQQLAKLKIEMKDEWRKTLAGVINEPRNRPGFRVRAIDTLNLYGPAPSLRMLKQLANDPQPEVRAKVATLLGVKSKQDVQTTLLGMLVDKESAVRTAAAESILRVDVIPDWEVLKLMLTSPDQIESLVARRILERIPENNWRDAVLTTDNQKLFCEGSLTLLTVNPTLENSYAVLSRISHFMDGFINDSRFVDMLRVSQIALDRGNIDPTKVNLFVDRIVGEFPAGNGFLNRELSRIIAYLDGVQAADKLVDYLKEYPYADLDKFLVALNFQVFANRFDSE